MAKQEICGQLTAQSIIIPEDFVEEMHNKGFYGRLVKKSIKLAFVEAAYLLYKQKINILHRGEKLDFQAFFKIASLDDKHFGMKYIVYKDLRERGYYVKPSVMDFRLYPRGGHPGKTPSRYLVHTLSERQQTPVSELLKYAETADNLKKRLVLAIVDEESDITFYELKKAELRENPTKALPVGGMATFLEDRAILWDSGFSKELNLAGFYGKFLDESHLQLSLVETAYLLKKSNLELHSATDEPITYEEFTKIATAIEPDFQLKYRSYTDLREKNLIPKTGFKFGAHFRVYKNYNREDKTTHSEYLVHAIPFSYNFSLPDFSRAVRLAHSVRKHIIYAVIRNEANTFNIDYLEIMRIKL